MSKELSKLKKRLVNANAVALTALKEFNDLRVAMQAKFLEYEQLSYEASVLKEEYHNALKRHDVIDNLNNDVI